MIRWKLREYLDKHNLSAYALAKQANISPTTTYGLARGDHERISLEVLAEVVRSLREMTGESVSVCDVMEYQEDAAL